MQDKLKEVMDVAWAKYSAAYDDYLAANAKAANAKADIAKDVNTSDRSSAYDAALHAISAYRRAQGAWVDFIRAAAAIP